MAQEAYGVGTSRLPRTVQITNSGGQVASFTYPDGTVTEFQYTDSSVTRSVHQGTLDGEESVFFLNAARQVRSVERYVDSSNYITTTLREQESQGVDDSATYAPVSPDSLYTWIEGPRTDTTVITRFYLDAYGEPDSIRDAMGNMRYVTHGDTLWPGLVTQTVDPRGDTVTASYDALGRPTTVVDHGVQSGGNYATTTYQWTDSACPDFPTKITRPEGDFVRYGYNSTWCVRTYQQDARGSSSRVKYSYNKYHQLVWIRPPLADTINMIYHSGQTGDVAEALKHDSAGVDTTTYEQDAWGEDTLIVTGVAPDTTRTERLLYDAMGRDTAKLTYGDELGDTLREGKRYGQGGLLLADSTLSEPDPNAIGWVTHTYQYDRLGRDTLSVGGGTTVSWTYDEAGNVIDGGPRPAIRTYDADNRMITQASDTFAYDAGGNLTKADNEYAQVHRGYDVAGRLMADTLWVAQFDTTTRGPNGFLSGRHEYVFRYGYDLDGRVLWQRPSDNLAPSSTYDSLRFSYDNAGFLSTANDPMDNAYELTYDAQGRPTSLVQVLTGGGTVTDTMAYDERSRLHYHAVFSSDSANALLSEAPTYDELDRMRESNGSGGVTYTYDPLGPLSDAAASSGSHEWFTTDAVGRRVSSSGKSGKAPATVDYYYAHGTGVLDSTITSSAGSDTTIYTFAGGMELNHVTTHHLNLPPLADTSLVTEVDYNYDGQDRMNESRYTADTVPKPYASYQSYTSEEGYWYDALGRRVLEWSWKQDNCSEKDPSSGCLNTVTRTVWAGKQIAYEIRAPWSQPDNDAYSGAQYRRVGYLYMGGLDQPVALWKATTVIEPHANARGVFLFGTCGTAQCDSSQVYFPGANLSVFGKDQDPPQNGPPSWYGSLITGQTDASGLLFRRNRYVDPTTGQFTQADPIGIAGGLNTYGYVGEDPVNFSDPLGLLACNVCDWFVKLMVGPAPSLMVNGKKVQVSSAVIDLPIGGPEEAGAEALAKGTEETLQAAGSATEGSSPGALSRLGEGARRLTTRIGVSPAGRFTGGFVRGLAANGQPGAYAMGNTPAERVGYAAGWGFGWSLKNSVKIYTAFESLRHLLKGL